MAKNGHTLSHFIKNTSKKATPGRESKIRTKVLPCLQGWPLLPTGYAKQALCQRAVPSPHGVSLHCIFTLLVYQVPCKVLEQPTKNKMAVVPPLWDLQFTLKTRQASYRKTQRHTLKQPPDLLVPECKIRKHTFKDRYQPGHGKPMLGKWGQEDPTVKASLYGRPTRPHEICGR